MRTSRLRRATVLAAVLSAAVVTPTGAHQGNPSFRSVIRAVSPHVPGLQVRVLGFDDRLELTNRTGRTVVVYGYDGEPYARVLASGAVQVNVRSPAVYLNDDRFGEAEVPASARPGAAPAWRTLDKTLRFAWHDHRIHWMARSLPPQVHDQAQRTKILDYRVPLRVGSERGQIAGTLLWVGSPSSGFPLAAVVSLVIGASLAILAVVLVRRRRAHGEEPSQPGGEAW